MKLTLKKPSMKPSKKMLMLGAFLLLLAASYAAAQSQSAKNVRPDVTTQDCPAGQVNYGVPLGCVDQKAADECKTTACPICLTPGTKIRTEFGEKEITRISAVDKVWSVDAQGKPVLVPVKKVAHVGVPQGSAVRHLRLSDGRQVYVSPGHPAVGGALVGQLQAGDRYDQATIRSNDRVAYSGYTYDLLPDSHTGYYWAGGILMGSTLK